MSKSSGITRMLKVLGTAAVLAAALSQSAVAQTKGVKLYVFSSGALTIGKGILQNLAPNDPPIQIPVGFFVIKHPKGTVLFDTGNNDKIITDGSYWGPAIKALNPVRTPDVAIDVQLAKIGVKPDDVTYVVPSHLHLDHGGNIAKFPNSTLLIQRDEIKNAFWPDDNTQGPYIYDDFGYLRQGRYDAPLPNRGKLVQLDGDLDLFRDGSVMIKKWPGHTPGSQMIVLRLAKTGTLVLTADTIYFRENVEKNLPPNVILAWNPTGILRAYEYVRFLQATENADYFTSHDPDAFKAMKKAPEYYE
ncbi:MAG: N-acyl homoserine lactonase family protein [Betaproteobacteria bacterium]|nr:N-acyl homoserine lactonase family protein [Betaproteobacteria bacterium]